MNSLRILIVEDEPLVATLIEELVRAEGHHVCGVIARGGEVVEAVRSLAPDVVLMDVHLKDGTSGIRATRELLRQVIVPVIIISGTDRPEELRDIAGSGALGFMKKPVTAEELQVNLRIANSHHMMMAGLRSSELLLRSFFDGAAVGIYICHASGFYLASNMAYARMLGDSGPASLLRRIANADEQVYVQPGRRKSFLERLEKGEVLSDMESQVYGKDGDVFWVSEHLAPHFDSDGVMTHYEGVAIDVTDKKVAENQRNVACQLMQITMDAIADYVAVTDLEGNIIFANSAFERDLGAAVGDERVLLLSGGVDCPWERFHAELGKEVAPGYQVTGIASLQGFNEKLHVGITRYVSPAGKTVGAVFVMRSIVV